MKSITTSTTNPEKMRFLAEEKPILKTVTFRNEIIRIIKLLKTRDIIVLFHGEMGTVPIGTR